MVRLHFSFLYLLQTHFVWRKVDTTDTICSTDASEYLCCPVSGPSVLKDMICQSCDVQCSDYLAWVTDVLLCFYSQLKNVWIQDHGSPRNMTSLSTNNWALELKSIVLFNMRSKEQPRFTFAIIEKRFYYNSLRAFLLPGHIWSRLYSHVSRQHFTPAMSNRICLLSQKLCHYLNQRRTFSDLFMRAAYWMTYFDLSNGNDCLSLSTTP